MQYSRGDFLFLLPSYMYYLKSFCREDLPLLCHLFVSAWIIFRLEPNAAIYFVSQTVLTLTIWEFFQIGSCVLLTYSFCLSVSLPCFGAGSSCISLAPGHSLFLLRVLALFS